jgi:hypothetical protein
MCAILCRLNLRSCWVVFRQIPENLWQGVSQNFGTPTVRISDGPSFRGLARAQPESRRSRRTSPQICFDLFRSGPSLFMRSPARIHWRIHESIHSGVRVGIHAGLHDSVHASLHGCIHEHAHGGIHDSVHESIHGGVHEIPPRLLDRMPDVRTKRVLHIHLIPQATPETRKVFEPAWEESYGVTKVSTFL